MYRIWKIITVLEFLSQGRRSDIFLNKIQAFLIFDPLIPVCYFCINGVIFKPPYFKMLNDARVASACLCVRTCQRVRNSKNIATIRDFHLPSSFFCLSTRLQLLIQTLFCMFSEANVLSQQIGADWAMTSWGTGTKQLFLSSLCMFIKFMVRCSIQRGFSRTGACNFCSNLCECM